MKKKTQRRLPGLLITAGISLAMILFFIGLITTKLFPTKMLILAGVIFLVLGALVFLLTGNTRSKGKMIAGIVLTVVIILGLLVGTSYLMDAVDTLNAMTQVTVEVTDMGIYVRQDDPAQELSDALSYRFGVMQVLDRENTNTAVYQLEQEQGVTLEIVEFDGPENLVDALVKEKQVDAIIINGAYLDLLADVEDYNAVSTQMRKLSVQQVETMVEAAPSKPENGGFLDQLNQPEEVAPEEPFVMYMSGIDSRGGLIAKSRCDVNILAVVNPETHQVLLVSTPRDFYVPLPISNGKPDKLTHAGIYGVDVSVGALEMLYETEIDYYFRVNFGGFEKIIDALGGITVNSEFGFTTSEGGYWIDKGENHLNGAKALSFARERKAFASGDRQRGKNQMIVIKSVIDKALSPAILTGYADLMASVSGSFETSMPYEKIAELVRKQLDEGGNWNVVSTSVDGTGSYKKPYSLATNAYVMIPNQETVDAAKEMINKVLNGETLQ